MEHLKSLFEALKSSAYSLAAILLPGALLLELVRRIFHLMAVIPWDPPVPYVVLAYVVGFVLQGAASWVFSWKRLDRILTDEEALTRKTNVIASAQSLLEKKYEVGSVPESSVIDIALTRASVHREVYDKFTALRDMARSLVIVLAVSTLAFLWRAVMAPNGWERAAALAAAVAVAIGACGAADRYRRFRVTGDIAIVGALLASELKEKAPKQDPPTT